MSFYIYENIEHYVVSFGFKTREEAEKAIRNNKYMKQYWWHYDVKEWTEPTAWGLVYDADSKETGGTTFYIFETWDEACAYACESMEKAWNTFEIDFDTDIFQLVA